MTTTGSKPKKMVRVAGRARRFGPIGLDAGSRGVRAAQVSYGRDGCRLERVASFPRLALDAGKPSAESVLLAGALRRLGFQGARVVMAPPPEWSIGEVVEVPPGDGVPREVIARAELARLRGVDANNLELTVKTVREAMGVKRPAVMVNACERGWAYEQWRTLHRIGLELVGIEPAGLAIARSVARTDPASAENHWVLVDLGWSAAAVRVMIDGSPAYERRLPNSGWGLLVETVAKELGVSTRAAEQFCARCGLTGDGIEYQREPVSTGAAETERRDTSTNWQRMTQMRRVLLAHLDTLADEITTAVLYAGRRYGVHDFGRVRLMGGPCDAPGVSAWIEERLSIESELLTPCRLATPGACGDVPASCESQCALAVALACGGGA